MKIGIFFGGSSREREISFAGGRTVYDNLNKSLFQPIPIFVDSFNNLVLINWQFIYRGSIRDFFPPSQYTQSQAFNEVQIYADSLANLPNNEYQKALAKIGQVIQPSQLNELIDFAFLVLHGESGEDGSIQGLLDFLQIPYSGSGVLPSAIGIDKHFQKNMMAQKSYGKTRHCVIHKKNWQKNKQLEIYEQIKHTVGIPFVSRPANQGSSLGVGFVKTDDFANFKKNIDKAFFIENISHAYWAGLNLTQKKQWLQKLCDIRIGIGLPVWLKGQLIYQPQALYNAIQSHFTQTKNNLKIEAYHSEKQVLIEEFIDGREFSCIVLKLENGELTALPPTEILNVDDIFDYRSKYLAGKSSKQTPIKLHAEKIKEIEQACIDLFNFFKFDVYARIDGFLKADGTITLNDPNTTSGMLPSSFFFHQAAEVGLNPSQILTYIIRNSIAERNENSTKHHPYQQQLLQVDGLLHKNKNQQNTKKPVAVILGGYSTERHISVESGRNIFEKLSSSGIYQPIPIFLTGNSQQFKLYQIPINILLKDNADDIADKINNPKTTNPFVSQLRAKTANQFDKYWDTNPNFQVQTISIQELSKKVDFAFIALHGRPGEDGALQQQLQQFNIPYNGSNIGSSQITIDKFKTLQTLKKQGFTVTNQLMVYKQNFANNPATFIQKIEEKFSYPIICKPSDDGCSSAVKKIDDRVMLTAFTETLFRDKTELNPQHAQTLGLMPKEEIPLKDYFLVEQLIEAESATQFLEVTCGLLTHYNDNGDIEYEIFEPSESVASHGILSLEEKFLAGEGQNITPARFSKNIDHQKIISQQVRDTLLKASKVLNIQGYARIDAFVRIYDNLKAETIIIEVNSLPGMTPATCIFHQAAINGYKPFNFIHQIIEFGIARENQILVK